jgi:hypothetical protein
MVNLKRKNRGDYYPDSRECQATHRSLRSPTGAVATFALGCFVRISNVLHEPEANGDYHSAAATITDNFRFRRFPRIA